MWVLDWVAPFGHTAVVNRLLRRQLFANRLGRMLYHRGDERGMKIKTFQGMAVLLKKLGCGLSPILSRLSQLGVEHLWKKSNAYEQDLLPHCF